MDRPGGRVAVFVLLLGLLAACGQEQAADRRQPEALPAPAEGSRWVSWRDVAVQVPDDWEFGHEPREDWCAEGETERLRPDPYVVLDPGYGPVLAIGCLDPGDQHDPAFGPAPEERWASHVALESADAGPALSLTDGPWSLMSRTVGDVRVRVLADDAAEAEAILATARHFEVDQNGCAPSSPVQTRAFVRPDPFDVLEVTAVDRVSVCQYQRGIPLGEPALMASRTMTGADADALLRGLQTAPAGGGPDRPDQCSEDQTGETGIALVLDHASGTDAVFVYTDTCRGNGTDDGTTRRTLTEHTCSPLFAPPVVAWSYSTSLDRLCG